MTRLSGLPTYLQQSWPALTAIAALVAAGGVVGAWRRHRRALRYREEVTLLPTESFDPEDEELARWAKAVFHTRRRRPLGRRRSEAVRFALSAGDDGLVTQHLSGTHRALAQLEPHVPHQVELQRPELAEAPRHREASSTGRQAGRSDSTEEQGRAVAAAVVEECVALAPAPRTYRARAELRITPSDSAGLAALSLKPDPLTPLVAALGELGYSEAATVALDLQPLSWLQIRLHRARARRRDGGRPDWTRQFTQTQLLNNDPLSRTTSSTATTATQPKGPLRRLEARSATLTDHDRFASGNAVFSAQLLIWADAPDPARARHLVDTLVAGLSPSHQHASWRRAGWTLGGHTFFGPGAPGRRRRFDHRAATGCFRPARPTILGAAEVAGLIKPPTAQCHAANALRGGGLVPPPPTGLAEWVPGTPGLFPIGETRRHGAKQWSGIPLEDTLFTARFGRSGWGKTEMALVECLALVDQPDPFGASPCDGRPAVLYLDPHGDAIARLKPYLTAHADRLLEINLSRSGDDTQAGWNPLDMTGCVEADVEGRVSMMAAAFAATLGWTERNMRGLNLITQATQSLCYLALRLPPTAQPTIFQVTTILADKAWREQVLRFLPQHQRDFWELRFAHQTGGAEAITPVTNLLDRLRASRHVAALFGQPRSTFNMRSAMDDGRIIALCPGGADDKEQLILAIMLFELFRATASRRDIADVAQRRPCHAFVDEMQVADKGEASELIARMLREGRKFGLRFHAMVQEPLSLSPLVLGAIATNRSHLFTTAIDQRSSRWLADQVGGGVDPATLTTIRQFHSVAAINHHGTPSAPFRVRGLSVPEVWGPPAGAAAVAALERTVDRTMSRLPIATVLERLDRLDADILAALAAAPVHRPTGSPVADTGRRRRARVTPEPTEPPLPPPTPIGVHARSRRPPLT